LLCIFLAARLVRIIMTSPRWCYDRCFVNIHSLRFRQSRRLCRTYFQVF